MPVFHIECIPHNYYGSRTLLLDISQRDSHTQMKDIPLNFSSVFFQPRQANPHALLLSIDVGADVDS